MRVLLVDDSKTMHRIQTAQLKELGIDDVLTANNGREGLEVLEAGMPVDIILLDINMPEMDGMEMLRQVKADARYSAVKVIMVTSEAEKAKVLEAVRAGASDYIVKPFTAEDFRERVLG